MTRTKKRRCTCGRPAQPDARTARIAAARGTRQSETALIQCVPYVCPAGGHHTMLWPTHAPILSCACGCPALPTLHAADTLLDHLTGKHPDPENPYTLYRCAEAGLHIARDRAVPASAERAATLQDHLRDTPIHRAEYLGNWA
jgi:hypothetical protein